MFNKNINETRSSKPLIGEETLKKASLAYYKDHRFDLFKSIQRLRFNNQISTTTTAINTNAKSLTNHINNEKNFERSSANASMLSNACNEPESLNKYKPNLNINKIKLKDRYKDYQISSNSAVSQNSDPLPQLFTKETPVSKENQEKASTFPKIGRIILYLSNYLNKIKIYLFKNKVNQPNRSLINLTKKNNSTFKFRNKVSNEFEKEISSDSIDSFCSREKQLNLMHSTPGI